VIHAVAMRWCVPTPKEKPHDPRPLVGWVFLLHEAAVKGYSVSHTLYFYSCALLMFVIMLAPVGKRPRLATPGRAR